MDVALLPPRFLLSTEGPGLSHCLGRSQTNSQIPLLFDQPEMLKKKSAGTDISFNHLDR